MQNRAGLGSGGNYKLRLSVGLNFENLQGAKCADCGCVDFVEDWG